MVRAKLVERMLHIQIFLSFSQKSVSALLDVQGAPISVSERTWDRLIDVEVGNKEHRLYGGSQYHRTLREFHLASKCLRLPTITEDEIANAAGVGEIHDGVNFLHAACVIALEKARVSFEPLLEALRVRVTHAMDRLCPVTEYMLRETGERAKISTQSFREEDSDGSFKGAADISQNPQFQQLIRNIFEKFVAHCSRTVSIASANALLMSLFDLLTNQCMYTNASFRQCPSVTMI